MTVRAKFTCTSKEHDTNDPSHGQVKLEAVTSGSSENEGFFSFTPWGIITLGTVNPTAFAQFEPGKEYYIDFTLADG